MLGQSVSQLVPGDTTSDIIFHVIHCVVVISYLIPGLYIWIHINMCLLMKFVRFVLVFIIFVSHGSVGGSSRQSLNSVTNWVAVIYWL